MVEDEQILFVSGGDGGSEVHRSDEERIKVGGNRGHPSEMTKGISLAGSESEEEEWARRAEEWARQQQEQFKRERLERLESDDRPT